MSAEFLDADSELETHIDRAYALMVAAASEPTKRKHWGDLVRLVHQRSPETIARMEAERRLTRPKQ